MPPEYSRGQGADQLPYGGATQVNQNTPPAAQPPGVVEGPGSDVPVQYGGPEPIEDTDGGSENMQTLIDAPWEGYDPTIVPKDREGRLPRYVVRHIFELQAAARDPSAPPAVLALYRAVVRRMEAEQR